MSNTSQTTIRVPVRYNAKATDPQSLAAAIDRLLETAISSPGILEEYGNPTIEPSECDDEA
jgi:hypothetical protein